MFFYLISKLLPLFFLPLGLGLFLLFLGGLLRNRKILIISFFVLFVPSLGIISEKLLNFIEHPWERIDSSKAYKADAIVVLSGSLHPSPGKNKIIEWKDPDRFFAGIDLYKKGKAPIILFTMGKDPFLKNMKGEGQFFLEKAIDLKIPRDSILITGPVKNTLEEAKETKKIINKINSKNNTITLVTSAFHMQRAKKVFEREDLIVLPFPVDFKSKGKWTGDNWKDPRKWVPNHTNLNNSSNVIREIIGRIIYKTF